MKIGLTFTGYGEKHQNYVKWLKGRDRDIDVVKLTPEGDPNDIRGCHALVLSGGVDIHPALYNGPLVYPKSEQAKGWKRRRDDFERSVFDHAVEHGLPILGVCRGLQLINVRMQGTLIQDLGRGMHGMKASGTWIGSIRLPSNRAACCTKLPARIAEKPTAPIIRPSTGWVKA